MSNNVLGCSSRWVANCELRGVWCGISRKKAASVLASTWSSTGECAVAVMNMDVVLWKGSHLGAIRHLSWMVRCSSQYCYSMEFLLKYWYACWCGWYNLPYVVVVS